MNNQAFNMDCMEAMQKMKDKEFDLAIVDPVYGDVTQGGYMKNRSDGHDKSGHVIRSKKYHLALWDQDKTGADYFRELKRVSKNQVIWGGCYFTKEIGENTQCWIVWDKDNGNSGYADFEVAWTSFNLASRIFKFRWNGMLQQDMKNKEERIHPTQKPVALYKWILTNYAKPGMKILDTHLGSGSSRIAAYDMGFDFTGYEIDKIYFEQQEERFKKHINQTNMFVDFGL